MLCAEKVLDELMEGGHEGRTWRKIRADLSQYYDRKVALRLYQRVLVPHHEAGNVYWKDLTVK